MSSTNRDEMENFQQLSDRYQPEIQGPLVGNKTSIHTLISEYGGADPTYIAKTTALAATHSAYRPIKGDGQCGWRGTVFGYFETLLLIGDHQMIVQEETRLRSFDETLRMAGIDLDLVIDMADYTWELFAKINQAVELRRKDDGILTEMFNDEMGSNSIVYHFKMMTSAYMALREDQYQPFLDMPLSEYRLTRIHPTNQEIDQIGLQALTDSVVAPAGMNVEVSYLDRSQGNEVTPHDFVPNASGWPTIRLLYRPGHYDMIYKDVQPLRVQLFRQEAPYQSMTTAQFGSQNVDFSSYLFPDASMYPKHSQQDNNGGSSGYMPPQNYSYVNDTQQHPFFNSSWSTYPNPSIPASHEPWSSALPMTSMATVAAPSTVASMSQSPPVSSPVPIQPPPEPQIRYNQAYYEFTNNHHESIPLETGSLRKSPGNQNHFLSTEFQPEIWDAKEEYGKP